MNRIVLFLAALLVLATQSTAALGQGSKSYPAPTPGSTTVVVDKATFEAQTVELAALKAEIKKLTSEPALKAALAKQKLELDATKAKAAKLALERDDALAALGVVELRNQAALKVIMEVKWQPDFPRDYTGWVLKAGGKAGNADHYFAVALDKSFTFKGKEWIYSSADRCLYEATSPPPSLRWTKK